MEHRLNTKRTLYLVIYLGQLCLSNFVHAADTKSRSREELLVVQTTSKDQHSFVVAKGIKDGITKGQEIIFANSFVSILCKAREVNRDYSLWIPTDPNVNIPFKKEDIISYNSHAYGNVALDIVGDVNITPTVDYNELYKKFRSHNNYALKGSIHRSLAQSSSDVSASNNSMASGYSFALEYNYRFMPEFEMSFGGRLDNEIHRQPNPVLDIPTTRVMGTAAVTYHFMSLSSDQNNFYLSLAAGIGKSTTTVGNEKSTGTVTLIPEARLGYLMPFSKSVAMIFEGSIESLNAKEKFSIGTEQTTNELNAKLTIGLRF